MEQAPRQWGHLRDIRDQMGKPLPVHALPRVPGRFLVRLDGNPGCLPAGCAVLDFDFKAATVLASEHRIGLVVPYNLLRFLVPFEFTSQPG
ncbi:hypothetical protein Q31a_24270 [Aureliella helgolandensis]|uniref:Uncharacterized protein n=1 Tax=Aureliella helgolandensis TaxID=2527968 RepID=A0A518G6C3_9BACT|nr:hypothetical protein Q31a_24270 [Aureliella helgolandensis]